MSIECVKIFFEIIYKYISQPNLVLYFESSESYHTRIVTDQNNTNGFFCHLMVKNTGRKTARNCQARVIEIQAKDTTGSFVLCSGFLNPFVLKWAHENNYNPKDIEKDIPVRLDLCCGLQNKPNKLTFITPQKPDGNQTIYPPGTYNVKIRINAENSQTVDGKFVIQFGGSWNDIQVIADNNIETEHKNVNSGDPKKEKGGWGKKIGVYLFGLAALATILVALFGDNIWGRFNKKLKSKKPTTETKEEETKQIAGSKLVLSLENICRDIDSRPLVQKDETAMRYVGVQLKEQELELFDIFPEDDKFGLFMIIPGQLDLTFLKGIRINFSVDKNEYPELNAATKGVKFYVTGKIKEADRFSIELSDVSLKFD